MDKPIAHAYEMAGMGTGPYSASCLANMHSEIYADPPPFEALEPEAAAVLQFIYKHQTPVRPVYPWPRVVERNDPCPCRSGRKAKKCCLKSSAA